MQKFYFILLLVGLFSCKSSKNEPTQEVRIYGTWTLFKEQKGSKEIDLEEKPTAISLNLKDNGYFIFFDKINDAEMTESGVGKIQERYKGQYAMEDGHLEMKYYENDSLIEESFKIKELSAEKLVLQDENSGLLQYWKR
ncbi:MAG: lipocalin family protein [Flavobacteriia bacterium]|jgi:hypothetical protein